MSGAGGPRTAEFPGRDTPPRVDGPRSIAHSPRRGGRRPRGRTNDDARHLDLAKNLDEAESSMADIRVALLGTSFARTVQAAAFQRHPAFHLAAIAGSDPAKTARIATELGI